jgi:hypothetical protein
VCEDGGRQGRMLGEPAQQLRAGGAGARPAAWRPRHPRTPTSEVPQPMPAPAPLGRPRAVTHRPAT